MDTVFLFTSIGFFLWLVRNILFWLWLWQTKEYRFDLLSSFLTRTTSGRDLWFSYPLFLKLFGVFLYIPTVFNEQLEEAFHLYVFLIFSLHGLLFIKELMTNKLRTPVITPRIFFIILPTFIFIVIFYFNPIIDPYLWLLLLDRFVLLVLSMFLFALSFPSEIYRDLQIEKARKRMKTLEQMRVISVTGGSGKGATTYMISQILSSRWNTIRTQKGPNTLHRIASRIKKIPANNVDILVAQIDAYKKSEILTAGELLKPHIAVITPISEQNEIIDDRTNYVQRVHTEVLAALRKGGMVLFNGSDQGTKRLYNHIITYFNKTGNAKKITSQIFSFVDNVDVGSTYGGVIVRNILLRKESVSFDLVLKGKSYRYHSLLLGRQSVHYLIPGLLIARTLGIPHVELKHIVSHVLPLEKHMIPYKTKTGSMLVDNSNAVDVSSVISILEYMSLYKGKKLLVFTPMTAISRHVKEDHHSLAKKIASVCDYLLLTNRHFNKQIVKGFYEAGGGCAIKYGTRSSMASFITKQLKTKDDVACFVGEESGEVLQKIVNVKTN